MVRKWSGDIATEWKCSCEQWTMELPSGPMRPQQKAALVHTAFTQHVEESHTVEPDGHLAAPSCEAV